MHLFYLPNIAYFQELMNGEEITFHLNDHYHRQTYRNRTEIVGPNGKMVLSIPTQKLEPNNRQYENIKISYAEPWLKQHWKSFESAYRRSAYFEYYEDKFVKMYEKPTYEYLWEYNLELLKIILNSLKINKNIVLNHEVFIEEKDYNRLYINKQYNQVFSNKQDFIPNLSVLDLLFNTGPQSKEYIIR